MATDITALEDFEGEVLRILTEISLMSLVTLITMCLLAHWSVVTVSLIVGGIFIVSVLWKTIRFGERNGRIADRVTALEVGTDRIIKSINHAIDSIKKSIEETGGKTEDITNV